jgi:hypothetical protein
MRWPEWEGKELIRTSRTRNSHPPWVEALRHTPCNRRSRYTRRSASFQSIGTRTSGKSVHSLRSFGGLGGESGGVSGGGLLDYSRKPETSWYLIRAPIVILRHLIRRENRASAGSGAELVGGIRVTTGRVGAPRDRWWAV